MGDSKYSLSIENEQLKEENKKLKQEIDSLKIKLQVEERYIKTSDNLTSTLYDETYNLVKENKELENVICNLVEEKQKLKEDFENFCCQLRLMVDLVQDKTLELK